MKDFSDAPSLRESPRLRLDTSQWGPVRSLCEEIDFPFDKRLERQDVLVAFVRELLSEVADMRHMKERLAAALGATMPSDGSSEALGLAAKMLLGETREELMALAGDVHDACHRLNPDDAHPTDHLIDMVSSCASAIRFGLESPCRSRHAANAAQHVWEQIYGVSRFDRNTPGWEKDWARKMLFAAIIGLLPQEQDSESNRKDGSSRQDSNATDQHQT